jgi:D-alanyl-D-alanine dipeptidase
MLTAVWLGCKESTVNSNFESIVRELCSADKGKKIEDLYTPGTLKSMKRAVKAGIVKEPGVILENYFTPDTRLKVIHSRIDGLDAVVRVRYLEHPVENVIGSEVDYRFLYQERKWKLDFKKEIDEIIRSSRSEAGRVYLKKKASKY